ncbi:hypothetical protein [Actinoplanes sp. NPDC020271]|uniref:hypothetical protein n=1 Tax=Actinoplanes sp. NPDC020271 TaxID=3363896 RepID=UPI0037B3E095
MPPPYQRTGEQAPAAAPPFPEDPTTATRHLCAAAYLDEEFRETALREVYHQPRRAVAPSHGFHLIPVLAHCLHARSIAIWRDGVITATLLIMLCAASGPTITLIGLLIAFHAVVATARLARDVVRGMRTGTSIDLGALAGRTLLLTIAWTAAGLIFFLGAFQQFADLAGSALTGGSTRAVETMITNFAAVFALGLLFFGIAVGWSLWRRHQLDGLGPRQIPSVPKNTQRLQEIVAQQQGNTAIYGDFDPFVGAGDLVGTWGFAQRLVRPPSDDVAEALVGDGARHAATDGRRAASEGEREFDVVPFAAGELIDHLRTHLTDLSMYRPNDGRGYPGPEDLLGTLTVTDRVYLAGTEVADLNPLLPAETVAGVIRFPTTPARHHLDCQVVSWGGELVTTVHVHVAVQGRSLYLEVSTTALLPTADVYRQVSTVDGTGPVAWWRALRWAVVNTPATVGRAPRNVARALATAAFTGGGNPMRRGLNRGALISVRELGTRLDGARNFTQYLDIVKYRNLIERRVQAATLDFLESRGVDTTEYRNRVNNWNIGGSVYGGQNNQYTNPIGGDSKTGGDKS